MTTFVARCGKKDCDYPGFWHPVLLVFPPEGHGDVPIRFVLGLTVCKEHKMSAVAEDFISDEGWWQIRKLLRSLKKMLPSRRRTKLDWVSLDSEEAQKLSKGRLT